MRDIQATLKEATRKIIVLDIETGNDPAALAMLGEPRGRGERPAIQRIRSACVLIASSTHHRPIELRSYHEDGEDLILERLADDLDRGAEEGALLVTFEGRRHDLPTIRRRAGRHMLFQRAGLTHWCGGGGTHLDLARDVYPPNNAGSLREAGFDIPLPEIGRQGDPPLHVRKGQLDCIATYLLLLHEQALSRGDGSYLLTGWRMVGSLLDSRSDLVNLRSMDRPASLPRRL